MGVKVSVVIPVYNAEKYLPSCIESLLTQTLDLCEFIFINDGSIDKSKKIIEEYAKADSRILLINQANHGVSAARNKGLNAASGEYIGFVDADDYVKQDMFETLYKSAENNNCDVVLCNFESEMEGHKFITNYQIPKNEILRKDYIQQELLPYFIKADNLNSVVNKLYNAKLVKEIEFPDQVVLGEDGLFNMKFFSIATSMIYLEYIGYHYREVAGSATRNVSGKDYFKRSLEVYHFPLPEFYTLKIDNVRIRQLKSIKLVNSVMSHIHVYLKPVKDMSLKKRYKYVKNMISNKDVREALNFYYRELYQSLGRYEKFILNMIKWKSFIGIYCAVTYSRFRNK
ncbi:glycosyltransferase [Pseudomonas sp. ISL-84]|nr:glycosyltransferase [Pseudomonas sp. ISL-84]